MVQTVEYKYMHRNTEILNIMDAIVSGKVLNSVIFQSRDFVFRSTHVRQKSANPLCTELSADFWLTCVMALTESP